MKPAPIWIVPVVDDHDFELVIEGEAVSIRRVVMVGDKRAATIRIAMLPPLVACQLGQALLDASKEAGARKAKQKP